MSLPIGQTVKPLTVPRTTPVPVRIASAAAFALLFVLAACGSTAGPTTTGTSAASTTQSTSNGGQGGAASVAAVVDPTGCNAAKATYTADTSSGATVKGGMGGKLTPSIDEILNTLAAQQPPISGSSIFGQLMPAGGTPGAICANGDIYKGSVKVATDAVLVTRLPGDKPLTVNDRGFFLTSANQALTNVGITACPALVWADGVGTPVQFVKAICLDNLDVVFTSKAVV